jgi:hypothetical protein
MTFAHNFPDVKVKILKVNFTMVPMAIWHTDLTHPKMLSPRPTVISFRNLEQAITHLCMVIIGTLPNCRQG